MSAPTSPSIDGSTPVLDPADLTPKQRGLTKAFRVMAIVEAFTWAGLLIGMLFKYVITDNEIGVQIFGPLHGGAFVIYCLLTLAVGFTRKWSYKTMFVGLLSSIPPFTTVVFERWAVRKGLLSL